MLSWLSCKGLAWRGWSVVGEFPKVNKCVLIVAPHTSNWDFFIFVALKFSLKVKVNFVAKHTIFIGPFGWILKKLGGRPVDRRKNNNMVEAICEHFKQQEKFIFAIAPEGTRSYKDHWKSGFYHIALHANVPIQLCYLDKKTKALGFGPLVDLSGDQEKDLEMLRAFYQDKTGINPELFSQVTFKNTKNFTKIKMAES